MYNTKYYHVAILPYLISKFPVPWSGFVYVTIIITPPHHRGGRQRNLPKTFTLQVEQFHRAVPVPTSDRVEIGAKRPRVIGSHREENRPAFPDGRSIGCRLPTIGRVNIGNWTSPWAQGLEGQRSGLGISHYSVPRISIRLGNLHREIPSKVTLSLGNTPALTGYCLV